MATPDITLPQHEAASESRAEHLVQKIDTLKGNNMTDGTVHNHFKAGGSGDGMGSMAALAPMAAIAALGSRGPMHDGYGGGGLGAGLGAGLVGGLLGGLLFGGRGGGFGPFGGNGGDGVGFVDRGPSPGQAAFDQTILTGITGLTASVPTVALQSQLALQNAISQLALADQQGFTSTTNAVRDVGVAQLAATSLVKDNVQNLGLLSQASFAATNQNILTSAANIERAIVNDGSATRALIQSIEQATLNRIITTQANEITELREEGRHQRNHDELKLQITNTNTAVAAQAQGQQQQQQQQILAGIQSLFPILQGVLQVAHATNGNVIAGNTGAVTTGAQTANPVNVAA